MVAPGEPGLPSVLPVLERPIGRNWTSRSPLLSLLSILLPTQRKRRIEHPPPGQASAIDMGIDTADSQRDDYLGRTAAVRVWEWFEPWEDGDR